MASETLTELAARTRLSHDGLIYEAGQKFKVGEERAAHMVSTGVAELAEEFDKRVEQVKADEEAAAKEAEKDSGSSKGGSAK